MKVIAFYELRPEDFDKVIAKDQKLHEERKRFPEKFPKKLFPDCITGYCKGFVIYEVDNEEQLMNLQMHLFPEMRFKFVPLIDAEKFMETYVKMKK